jgi:hypothetical protein
VVKTQGLSSTLLLGGRIVAKKKDLLSEDTFVSFPDDELVISKSATIYCGRTPRLEAHGKSKALSRKSVGIGRDKSNAVIIADPKVSKFHALVKFKGDTAYIRDSQSTNGTTVNGEHLPPSKDRAIKDGDVVVVGTTELRMRY